MPHNQCKSLTCPDPCNMGAWCLLPPSPHTPPPSPFPLHDWRSPFQLVAWGWGSPSPWPQTSPPKHWWSAEKSVDERLELCGGGGCERSSSPTLTLPPSWLTVTLPAWGVGAGQPIPLTPNLPPPPNTDGQLRSPWMGDENCGGGGGVRGQAPPSLMGSLYRNTEEVTALYNRLVKSSPIWRALISRLLLRRLISLRAFSYDAKFHCAPSPTAHSFIPRILLWRLIFLSAFSYGA